MLLILKVSSQKITSLTDREMKEYEVYKLAILFFALVDQIFEQVRQKNEVLFQLRYNKPTIVKI